MNEMEVFLKSEIGEVFLGTVGGIAHSIPSSLSVDNVQLHAFLMDMVSEVASNPTSYFYSSLSIELREPIISKVT